MTERICDRCHEKSPVQLETCSHCGYEFPSHEATLHCKIHNTSYPGRVSPSGEILSGHYPLCMESDDEEIARIDRDIASLQKDKQSLLQKSQGRKLVGIQLRIWGIAILSITCGLYIAGTIYSSRTFVPESVLSALAAVYLAATFAFPFLPFSPTWWNASRIATIDNQIQTLMQKKTDAIRRSVAK